jgi:hypothetical protein
MSPVIRIEIPIPFPIRSVNAYFVAVTVSAGCTPSCRRAMCLFRIRRSGGKLARKFIPYLAPACHRHAAHPRGHGRKTAAISRTSTACIKTMPPH